MQSVTLLAYQSPSFPNVQDASVSLPLKQWGDQYPVSRGDRWWPEDGPRQQHVHASRLLVWDTLKSSVAVWTVCKDDNRKHEDHNIISEEDNNMIDEDHKMMEE